MTIFLATNDPADIPGMMYTSTSTSKFDSIYTDIAMSPPMSDSASSPVLLKKLDAPVSELWTHFRYVPGFTTALNIDGYFFHVTDAAGNRIAGVGLSDARFYTQAFGSPTVTSAYTAAVFAENAQLTFDIRVKVDANILIEVYMGGTVLTSVTAPNNPGFTGISESVLSNQDAISSNSTGNLGYFSEIIVADESTIGARVATLKLTGAGALSQWDGDYTTLADRNSATGVTSDTAGERVSAALTYRGPASADARVIANEVSSAGAFGPETLAQFLRIGGVNYDSPARTVKRMELSSHSYDWSVNPATGAPWNTADFTGMEVGLLTGT